MPKGIPLTDEEVDKRRHEIFNASIDLFLKNGFQETSMQEIARTAGMGKSSLYDYFKTKEEILIAVVEDEIYDLTEQARLIARQPLPPAEILKQVIRAHLEYLLKNKEFYTRILFEVQRLGIQAQQRMQLKRHAYQDLLCSLIEQAIQRWDFQARHTFAGSTHHPGPVEPGCIHQPAHRYAGGNDGRDHRYLLPRGEGVMR